jgi:hypothetical protein
MDAPEKAKIVTSFNFGWTAIREDYDLGMPVGTSLKSEADAIQDLLECEAMMEEDDAVEEAHFRPAGGT